MQTKQTLTIFTLSIVAIFSSLAFFYDRGYISGTYGLFYLLPADVGFFISAAENIRENLYYRNLPLLLLINTITNIPILFYFGFSIYILLSYAAYVNKCVNYFYLILVATPNALVAMVFPSKEMFIILSFMSVVIYSDKGLKKYLVFAMVFAIFSRIEFIFILFVYIFLHKQKKSMYSTIFMLIVLLSLTLFYGNVFRGDEYREVFLRGLTNNESIPYIIDLLARDYFLYPVILPIKLIASISDGGVFNQLFFPLMFFLALARGINSRELIFILIYIIYATYPSFPHFRYLAPLYFYFFYLATRCKINNAGQKIKLN